MDTGINMTVTLSIQGQGDGVKLTGVKAVFLSANRRVIESHSLGTMANERGTGYHNFSVVLPQRPHYINFKYDSLSQPSNAAGDAIGLRLTDKYEGIHRYRTYSDYDPEY
ncbi:hypothetical protein I7X12_05860 [Halosimplex litoreum]|uniref:Uncharacterized protein n=1 Tax=Halosimplex litoreum TaxID=1198301 RepID=A0A7T3G1C8_9EURY|nr:hypothetical protein [Halosimplex litoreum]QPV64148.1 hypothetical protein I7X12_05860 [Halosimplex litoreum]